MKAGNFGLSLVLEVFVKQDKSEIYRVSNTEQLEPMSSVRNLPRNRDNSIRKPHSVIFLFSQSDGSLMVNLAKPYNSSMSRF